MTNQKTTIKDIALAAGVSTPTISPVLNNRLDVSSETRKRVLQTIANLNYSPNARKSIFQGVQFSGYNEDVSDAAKDALV